MGKSVRFSIAALLAAGLITLTVGCGKGEEGKNGADGANAGGATPEETFKTAKAALEKEDMKTFLNCTTSETKDIMAGGMAMAGMMMQGLAALGGEEGAAKTAKIKEALEKHGLNEEFFKKLEDKEKPADEMAAMKIMLEPVKDRAQFVADMMTALKAMGDEGGPAESPLPKDLTLKDVKIDGDTAKGTVEFEQHGEKKSEAIAFKKVDGKWLMDMTDMMKKEMGPPGGAPPVGGDLPIDFPSDTSGDLPSGDQPTGDAPTEDAPAEDAPGDES